MKKNVFLMICLVSSIFTVSSLSWAATIAPICELKLEPLIFTPSVEQINGETVVPQKNVWNRDTFSHQFALAIQNDIGWTQTINIKMKSGVEFAIYVHADNNPLNKSEFLEVKTSKLKAYKVRYGDGSERLVMSPQSSATTYKVLSFADYSRDKKISVSTGFMFKETDNEYLDLGEGDNGFKEISVSCSGNLSIFQCKMILKTGQSDDGQNRPFANA